MPKLMQPISYETTFATYTVDEQIGEGGAGRVYGGIDPNQASIAIKVLTNTSSDKRARFQNEIAFLQSNRHPNVVSVIDHGLVEAGRAKLPFYVMPRYAGSLRLLLRPVLAPGEVLPRFSQILDGVEAAHLKDVIHRDLKPENILYRDNTLAVADFGTARFNEDLLIVAVQTGESDRLANFQYAAPEQRRAGQPVSATADIYALGLILNEMFTGAVPHGTDYVKIGSISKHHEYLDTIVEQMLRQAPGERPSSISEVKTLIQRYESEAVALQRLSTLSQTVIKAGEIDEPLAYEPPHLIDARWDGQSLILTLDRPVNADWVRALQTMGNYTSVMGLAPDMFRFAGARVTVPMSPHSASLPSNIQMAISYFKDWLPRATINLRHRLEAQVREQEQQRRQVLQAEREAQERLINVNRQIRV